MLRRKEALQDIRITYRDVTVTVYAFYAFYAWWIHLVTDAVYSF